MTRRPFSLVKIPIEKWCLLCNALSVPPDTPIERVIEKARKLQELLNEKNVEIYRLTQGRKS